MHTITLSKHNAEDAAATAVEYLQEGGVVLVPTDTAYALAADAANEEAVKKVFEMKGRPDEKAASVVVADREQAEAVGTLGTEAVLLWETFMPGPLTLVVPYRGKDLALDVTHEGRTIGLRCPGDELTRAIAERLGRPFTATSANRSGHPPSYDPAEYLDSISDERLAPHLVLDAGRLPIRPVSTVVTTDPAVQVLREEAIPAAAIMDALGG